MKSLIKEENFASQVRTFTPTTSVRILLSPLHTLTQRIHFVVDCQLTHRISTYLHFTYRKHGMWVNSWILTVYWSIVIQWNFLTFWTFWNFLLCFLFALVWCLQRQIPADLEAKVNLLFRHSLCVNPFKNWRWFGIQMFTFIFYVIKY